MHSKVSPKVFAVVINDSGKEALLSSLNSLYFSGYENLEIIVLENDSKDGSFEAAKYKFPKIYFISTPANTSSINGLNSAARFALEKMADYVLIMSSSILIKKDALSEIVKTGETSEKIGIVSPVILNQNVSSVLFAGGKIFWQKMEIRNNLQLSAEDLFESDYVSNKLLLIKKSIFSKVGLLDEEFENLYADLDLCWRAKKAGFKILINQLVSCSCNVNTVKKNIITEKQLSDSADLFFKKNSAGFQRIIINFLILKKIIFRRTHTIKEIMPAEIFNEYRTR